MNDKKRKNMARVLTGIVLLTFFISLLATLGR